MRKDKIIQLKKKGAAEVANGIEISLYEKTVVKFKLQALPSFKLEGILLSGFGVGHNLGREFMQAQNIDKSFKHRTLTYEDIVLELPVQQCNANENEENLSHVITKKDETLLPEAVLEDCCLLLTEQEQLDNIVRDIKDNNLELGDIKDSVHFIRTQKRKIVTAKPYLFRLHLEEQYKNEFKRLLNLGIIVDSFSPFSYPALPLLRRNSGDVRIIIDYRKLNAISIPDQFPLPRINEILIKLKDAKIFSVLDLNSGYYQIRGSKVAQGKTSFVTSFRQYEFTRMPFGLNSAP